MYRSCNDEPDEPYHRDRHTIPDCRADTSSLMSQIVLDIPDETLAALKVSPEAAGEALCMAAAAKLYEMGRLSSGAAAKLAGVPRVVFLSKLADYGVNTFNLSREDLEGEVRFA